MTSSAQSPRRVLLRAAAAQTVAREAASSADGLETGGLLLGHVYDDHVEVRYAGGPGPSAYRSADRFSRDLDHATAVAEAAWQLDGSVWLGEWHTHLEFGPAPSAVDLTTYRGHMTDPDLKLPCFTALIVVAGPERGWAEVAAYGWSCTDTACHPVALTVHDDTASPPKLAAALAPRPRT